MAIPRSMVGVVGKLATRTPIARTVATSARLDELSRKIFGTLPNRHLRTGNKVLRQRPKGEWLADYYFDEAGPTEDKVGRWIMKGWLNDHEEWRQFKLQGLRRRGKGPPKKGQGRRSKKRK